ncbi:MAG TPA: Ig-like domain-containing protein, partial [Longimicrobiales bacterium]|nr:Ig-like domain-containing protein [Longimicrobiales bacterium]
MSGSARAAEWRPRASRAAAALAVLAAACASAQPPPGGEEDQRAPRIVEVWPEPFASITELERPAVFRFDERISERGADDAAILVSPRTGRFDIERGRREIRVEPVGGWRPETVYRVVLLPGVRDLFGNERTEPAELVFSTGPIIPNTAIAGTVVDRITGRAVAGALVEAVRLPDSLTHVALTDSAGFFAIRHAPPAEYGLRAFRDVNRNRALDGFEERGEELLVLGVSDTAVVTLALLAPDSTPARLAQATAVDSLAVRLLFDDYLDPDRPPADLRAWLFQLPDTVAVPVDTVLFPHRHAALEAARAAAAAA